MALGDQLNKLKQKASEKIREVTDSAGQGSGESSSSARPSSDNARPSADAADGSTPPPPAAPERRVGSEGDQSEPQGAESGGGTEPSGAGSSHEHSAEKGSDGDASPANPGQQASS